ncbi:MAG: RHS repeat-associated core domain-containing protein [Oscillospiraceae bacterium]|nr:RHS repeat-associated core domain-containing protein [Oscillospiraceae bacterium]
MNKSEEMRYTYDYDSTSRLLRWSGFTSDTSSTYDNRLYDAEYKYDEMNNVSKYVVSANGISHWASYTYGKDNLPETHKMSSAQRQQTFTYDTLNRLNKMEVSTDTPISVNYLYYMSDRNATGQQLYRTTQLGREIIGDTAFRYEYDAVGNITEIQEGYRTGDADSAGHVTKVKYTYDALGQLTQEENVYSGKTTVYTYDNGGNITSKKEYDYTTGTLLSSVDYGYNNANWKDLMTTYGGQDIEYDTIGNPTSYRGYAITWEGRQIKTLSGNGTSAGYKYDASGLRTSKTIDGVKTDFLYDGGRLVYEKRGTREIRYTYNGMGNLSMISYKINGDESRYYPVCNYRGDVEAIYSAYGDLRVRYIYDAWGNIISITDGNGNVVPETSTDNVGIVNRIRYRGYYYDAETELYYLQSRYYNPETGRFLNADSVVNSGHMVGHNLFTYCYNNPVMYVDYTGCIPEWVLAIAGGAALADGPIPVGDVIALGILGVAAITAIATAPKSIPKTAPNLTEIIPFPTPPQVPKNDNKKDVIPAPAPSKSSTSDKKSNLPTYYHATSADNAAIIWASGALMGSTWEGGYVYAWSKLPSQKAVQLSGAHSGTVIISFQTSASFVPDPGITDPYVRSFGPLQSALGRNVGVQNVIIVARY